MPECPCLSDLVTVRGRFLRSVHVERDFYAPAGNGYHLTECPYQTLEAIATALEQPTERAMALIGPYGSGKSAFCVHLAGLLQQAHANGIKAEKSAPPLLQRLASAQCRLIPTLMVGARQPIGPALIAGLIRGLERGGYARLLGGLREECSEILASTQPSPRDIARLFETAAGMARREGAEGLLLIIDEMGKFLEYASQHPAESDIFTLQELAEAASRSDIAPLLVLTVLHQSADAYAQKLGREQQSEWIKVGERFRQIAFFPSDVERMDMVGRAMQHAPVLVRHEGGERLSRRWLGMEVPHGGLRDRFTNLASAAYPLHPLALLALPALFRKTGQSHRSMFQFLSGEESYALGRFLRETLYDPARPPLYMPAMLFDYAAEVLVGGWSGTGLARLWAEAVESIERAHHVSPRTRKVLKVIALFGMLRDPRLPATGEMIQLALADGGEEAPDVCGSLEELIRRRLVVHSKRLDTYRLWEGGDVDVEAEMENVRSGLPVGATLHVATNLCPPPRLVARRHSYRTGVVRVVHARAVQADQLAMAAAEAGESLQLLFSLASTPAEAAQAEVLAGRTIRSNLRIAVALETEMLREAARDVAAAERVEKEADGLQGDRAAQRELAARRQEAEAAFRAEWNRLYGPQPGGARWFYRGKPFEMADSRAFSAALNEMAEATYSAAPRLRNELINRQALSSAAAAGRRNLLEAMLTHASEESLGFSGYPPERSMYACLLHATGLHARDETGTWSFLQPPEEDPAGLRPCWEELERLVFCDPPDPRPLPTLYQALREAPYGLTEGVLPVLLLAFMLANADETTLYREGTFVPEPGITDFEVLLRRPELFAVAGCRVVGDRAAIVERLARGLHTRPAVVPVVRALFHGVQSLPEYARKTRQLPAEVLALRDAFEKARSPERLLFHDLPYALRVTVMAEQEVEARAVEEFFSALNAALAQWKRALPDAVVEARDHLLTACGLPPGEAGWRLLREQAVRMEPRVSHARLRPFLHRAAQAGDSLAILESVLAYVADRPPQTWGDADAERCRQQAGVLGELFRSAVTEESLFRMTDLAPAEQEMARSLVERLREQVTSEMSERVLRAALAVLARELDDTSKLEREET